MITKLKRMYRSILLAGTGLFSLIFMAFNYLGIFATQDILEGLKEIDLYQKLRISAYDFFSLNKPFVIEGQKITLEMIKDASEEAAFAVILLKALAFCLTVVMITSIILLIAGLVSGVKDIFKKNLVCIKPLILDKITHAVVLVHGIAVIAATFLSLVAGVASIALFEDLSSYVDGFACVIPRLGSLLLLALAIYAMSTIVKFDKKVFRVPYIVKAAYTCSGCGAAYTTPAQFCSTCGSTLALAQAQLANPYFIDDTDVENFNYALIPFYAKKLWDKIQAFLKEKNIANDLLLKAGAALGGIILVVILAVNIFGGPAPKYVVPDQYLLTVYDAENTEGTIFVVGGKKINLKLEGSVHHEKKSLDGTITAFLDDENTLYVVKKKKLVKVAENVDEFELSAQGGGIAYINEEDELMLYSVSKGSTKKIAEDVIEYAYVLSPDGKSIAYSKTDGEELKMYVSINGKDPKKVGTNLTPLGLSNKGKFVYYINIDKSAFYVVQGNKDPQKLAAWGSIADSHLRFNMDHTQAMFTLDSGTYITSNGKEKVKITSRSISQFGNYLDWGYVVEAIDSVETLPIKTFAGQYFTSGNSLYYLNKRFEAKEVESADGIEQYKMTLTGDVIYYLDDGVLYRGTGRKAKIKFKEVAGDVSSFQISSDGKFCYFKTYDSALMCAKKTGKAKLIADDVKSFKMSHDDYLFFIAEGDLYASHNRGKKKLVASDVDAVITKVDVTCYSSEGSEYIAPKKTKFSKLVDLLP